MKTDENLTWMTFMIIYKKKFCKRKLGSKMLQHLTQFRLQKNRTLERDNISVTIYELYCKNYLNLSYAKINSLTWSKKLSSMLARANSNFTTNHFNKKNIKRNYDFLATLTIPVSVSMTHVTLSPLLRFKKSLTVAGIVVVIDPATDCIFVSYFICIPPIYAIHYINMYIYLFTNIYKFLKVILYRNLYILISS